MTAYERERKYIIDEILTNYNEPIKIAFYAQGMSLTQIQDLTQMLERNGFEYFGYTFPQQTFIFIRYAKERVSA